MLVTGLDSILHEYDQDAKVACLGRIEALGFAQRIRMQKPVETARMG